MHEQVLHLQAPNNRMLHLWFEPWAEGIAFPACTNVELHAASSYDGTLEVDETLERTAIYGWSGCTLRVIVEGKLIKSFDQSVPEAFGKLSTKATISTLFGPPPVPTVAEGANFRVRPWWRFWR
jgi:hypothetical protein